MAAKVCVRRRCGLAAVVDYRPGRAPLAWRTPTTRATGFSWLPTSMVVHPAIRRLQQQLEWQGALGWSPRLYGDCRVCSSKSSREGIGIARASSGLRCSSAQKPCVVVVAKADHQAAIGAVTTASEVSKRLLYVWHACGDLLCSRGWAVDALGG